MARIISVSACVRRIFPDSGGIPAAERNDFRDIRPNMNLTEAVKLISEIPDEKQPFRRFRNGSAPAAENHKECRRRNGWQEKSGMMRSGVLLNGEKAMFENTEKTLLFMRDSDDCGHRCYYDLSEIIKTLINPGQSFLLDMAENPRGMDDDTLLFLGIFRHDVMDEYIWNISGHLTELIRAERNILNTNTQLLYNHALSKFDEVTSRIDLYALLHQKLLPSDSKELLRLHEEMLVAIKKMLNYLEETPVVNYKSGIFVKLYKAFDCMLAMTLALFAIDRSAGRKCEENAILIHSRELKDLDSRVRALLCFLADLLSSARNKLIDVIIKNSCSREIYNTVFSNYEIQIDAVTGAHYMIPDDGYELDYEYHVDFYRCYQLDCENNKHLVKDVEEHYRNCNCIYELIDINHGYEALIESVLRLRFMYNLAQTKEEILLAAIMRIKSMKILSFDDLFGKLRHEEIRESEADNI